MITKFKHKFFNFVTDKKFSEILSGSVWAVGARLINVILAMITSVIIARVYGAEVLGVVAILTSFLVLATIFTVLGTNTSILRLIPEHIAKYSPSSAFKVYRKTQFLVIGFSLITGLLFFFAADIISDKIFGKPHLLPYFKLTAIFIVFKSIMLLNTSAVRGLRLYRVFALMQVLPQATNFVFLLTLGFFWANQNVPVYAFLGGFAVTGIAGWVIMQCNFKEIMTVDDKIHTVSSKQILSLSTPMLMTAMMNFLIAQTGVLILGMFRSEAEVGYYAIAVKLATLTTFILTAITSMAAPKFSELFFKGKMDDLFYIAKKSTKLIFWLTAPLLLILLLLGNVALSVVFGKDFSVAYFPMVLLIFGQFVNSISGSTGMFMSMTGREKQYRNIMLLAAFINIVINLLFIPKFGSIGAAIAGMCSLIFWNITTLVYIKKIHGKTIGYFPLSNLWLKRVINKI